MTPARSTVRLFRFTAARSGARPATLACREGRLALLLGLVACGGSGEADAEEDFTRSTQRPGGREVALSSSVGTAQSGTVNFSAEGDSLLVSVELNGLGAGAHRGFIRHGESCDSPGAAIIELPTVTGSASLGAEMSQWVAAPDSIGSKALVVYHEPNQTPGHVILCGVISAEAVR
jgi:hypothetical protein